MHIWNLLRRAFFKEKPIDTEMPPLLSKTDQERHDPFQALRYPQYLWFAIGKTLGIIAYQMQATAIGWELYDRTHAAIALAWVGLVQFLPVMLFALPAGQLADRLNRRHIIMASQLVQAGCSLELAYLSFTHGPLGYIYVLLGISGTAIAFSTPANSAVIPHLVPNHVFPNAAVWNSSTFQTATVLGPALGGALIALQHSATQVYVIDALLTLVFFVIVSRVTLRPQEKAKESMTLRSMLEGLRYVWRTRVIFAALTLDMLAVLFGGVTMLLPIYAADILQVGPSGLGWLRAAPSIGATAMAVVLAFRPPLQNAGPMLLLSVAGFGLTTIVFGLSKLFWLSMLMLIIGGALDNISMVIRYTLVQIRTPDWLRGRVGAVNNVFISSSNQLGGFESNLVASWFGPVVSVVAGGAITVLVVMLVALKLPQLRELKSLKDELA